ncbi:MAG: valine--tRNA ligase [Candidatus Diapherotrites archaeon]|jgi:valyl-tRNA synthetase|uniref:Valine--tRNA ligase n=1 Tax=Candidatus Iainarchaeum sp. TaxID=3101447 RepID=A0A8T5GG10_9ARCH|nr:valine--tRNA ligase [Candidatus Diapherotrites archaeon]
MIKDKKFTKEMELAIYSKWKKDNIYSFNPDTEKEVYSIDTPPPYINSPVHIGHASTYVIMDFIAKYQRMAGKEVLFPLGLDQNGLPIEISAERKYKVDFTKIGRKEAIEYCRKLLNETTAESVDSFFKAGIGFSSWKDGNKLGDMYQTDSPTYRALTQSTFIDLWKKGLIYEDNKVVNWDPKLQTTVADAEIEYENRKGFFHDIVFKEKESGEEVVIGTTRPELICTCEMVIYNPKDDRYKHLEGKTLITPYFEKEVIVKAHPVAEIDKGTGIMMMCSYGDLTDIRFFMEQKLNGKVAINKDGTLNENAGDLAGLTIREGREKVVETLKENGLLKKMTPTGEHRTPISERSGAAVEFVEMKEFYLKQLEYKDDMRRIAEEVNIYSPKSRQILLDWIDAVSIDWPISRRRYYATEVPMWKCKKCGEYVLAEKGKYVQPWKEEYKGKCKCGASDFEGEERVFDTWFDSSISPLYVLGYERHPDFFKKNDQCSLRPQGKEIVRTWLYYTLLKDFLLTGKTIFKDAWINYHILDDKGYKMAKRKGNGIDPHKVMEKFGAGPFRLWCAVEGNLDRTDFRCSFQRIETAGKQLEKLWNVSKFVSMFELSEKEEKNIELMEADKWILKEANEIAEYAKKQFGVYDFHNPVVKAMNFIRDEFASNYLEMVKRRAYNNSEDVKFSDAQRNGAVKTLRDVLRKMLEVLFPINSAMNYYLYKELFGEEITNKSWPKSEKIESEIVSEDLIEFNSSIWKAKKDNELSLKDSVKMAIAPKSLAKAETELKAMHNIENLEFGDKTKITIK